jgi:hypothetical protein
MTDTQITLDAHAIQALLSGDPDALRILAQNVLQKTLEAQMDDHLGAQRYERSEQRTGSRNGHYERKLTTRVGQLTLRVPRDREGTFSMARFERCSRSERALVATLVEMVVCGVRKGLPASPTTSSLSNAPPAPSLTSGHLSESWPSINTQGGRLSEDSAHLLGKFLCVFREVTMRLLVTLLCVALALAGCSDTSTQRGVDPDDPDTPGAKDNGQNPSLGDGSTTGNRTGEGGADVDDTEGIRREGDTVVRESDGFVFDPEDVNHYKDDENNPYPLSLRQFTCGFAASTDHLGVLYITSRECVPDSRAEQCGLIPQDVSIPHCVVKGTVVSSLKGLPTAGETFEFVVKYEDRTFTPQVDDIVFASFLNLRGVAITSYLSFVAPPVEFRDAYPDGFPERTLSDSTTPDSIDGQADMILESDCPRATKQHKESVENLFFARSFEC